MIKIKSGIGYDCHRIQKGNGLVLGGMKICDDLVFIAHSDGDILLHALIDSLLGAMGERDIGELFPDTDPRYKDISSRRLLEKTLGILEKRNYEIMNVDCLVIAQRPKIAPFKSAIRKGVSRMLGVPEDDFNIKAKTKEKLDAVGRGEAMECFCISMIRQNG